ncbi:MAG: acyl-phosphate--glycerol-3-phosphate O-acyltransferase, partial [Chloroflexi bacterium]|nr:acyl-phosphate--glycerol-3-phosphate O-acyltransferase [Chloroflexota bacterium]
MDLYMLGLSCAFICLSYLLGSIPIGLIISMQFKGIDVRQYGSGKTGTTNILRTIGVLPAILVIFLDILKGSIPIIIS